MLNVNFATMLEILYQVIFLISINLKNVFFALLPCCHSKLTETLKTIDIKKPCAATTHLRYCSVVVCVFLLTNHPTNRWAHEKT